MQLIWDTAICFLSVGLWGAGRAPVRRKGTLGCPERAWECPQLLLASVLSAFLPLPQLMFNNSFFRWRRTLCTGSFLGTGPCWTPCCHDYAALSSQMTKFQSHWHSHKLQSHLGQWCRHIVSHCGNCQWLFRAWPPVKGSFFQLIQRVLAEVLWNWWV